MKKFEIIHECDYMTGHIKGSMKSVVEAENKEEALEKYNKDKRRFIVDHIITDVDLEDYDLADYLEPEIREIKEGEDE